MPTRERPEQVELGRLQRFPQHRKQPPASHKEVDKEELWCFLTVSDPSPWGGVSGYAVLALPPSPAASLCHSPKFHVERV